MRRAACLAILALTGLLRADDWPCWRGPRHDGISRESGWLDHWPQAGPTVAWKATVGTGFAAVAVADGRLYTLGNRDNQDTLVCLDAATGRKLWDHPYPAPLDDKLFEGGPTATPTVDGGKVYSLSRWGDLFCLDAANGKVTWSRKLPDETGLRLPGWGLSGSPLVLEDLLLLNFGGAGVALEKATGKVAWKSEDKEPGYSSPVPFRRDGEWYAVVSAEDGFAAVLARTGKPLWQFRWVTRYGLNAADPIIAGDGAVFITSGYGKGGALLKTAEGQPAVVWKEKTLRCQFSSPVLIGGHLYGVDGDTNAATALRCVDVKTGAQRWSWEGVGSGALTAADGRLIVLTERGELLVAPASPEGFQPTARAQVLDGKCWTAPVLAGGRVYCRSAAGDLVCLDVRRK